MNAEQLSQLRSTQGGPIALGVLNLTDRSPRTLLSGEIKSGADQHVYIGHDGRIHVLVHVPLLSEEGPGKFGVDFLVLSHTAGPYGGLRYPADYVPDGRVFPEFSDFEFCKLLEDRAVHIPFAPILKEVPANQVFHAAIVGQGRSEKGIDLLSQVKNLHWFPRTVNDPDRLAYRLVAQAALETKVASADMGLDWPTYVAESGVTTVLGKVDEYLLEMHEKGLVSFQTDDLVFSTLEKVPTFFIAEESDHKACLMFSVNFVRPVSPEMFARLTKYTTDGKGYDDPVKFSGTYRGRPFVMRAYVDDFDARPTYRVYFSRFGDPAQFLKDMVGSFELEQPV
jgi:hypothetical protein